MPSVVMFSRIARSNRSINFGSILLAVDRLLDPLKRRLGYVTIRRQRGDAFLEDLVEVGQAVLDHF